MATATKKIDLTRVLADADEAIDAKADEVKAELVKAQDALPALRERVQDIEDGLSAESEVRARARQGEAPTGLELAAAKYDDELVRDRLYGLTSRVAVLAKALPVETMVLAERTANVLRTVMQGFNVYVTRADPKLWAFPEDETAIVVYADKGIERDPRTGLVSGTVKVLMHRPGLYRPINVEAFETAAAAERLALTVQSNNVGDEGGWVSVGGIGDKAKDPNDYTTDVLNVRLSNVIDGHAVIRRVDTSGLHSRTWVEEVFRANGSQAQGVPGTDKPWLWGVQIGRSLVAVGHNPEVVSESVNDNGIRTLVAEQKINTFHTHPGDFAAMLGEAMKIDRGLTYMGCGVLVDSEVESLSTVPETQAANWKVTLIFESRVA